MINRFNEMSQNNQETVPNTWNRLLIILRRKQMTILRQELQQSPQRGLRQQPLQPLQPLLQL